jgi:hypothetical protein
MPPLYAGMRAPSVVRLLAAALLALIAVACKPSGPPPLVDDGMASCLTSDTLALAVADLDKLRGSPFVASLSGSARDLLAQYGNDSKLLIAWNGRDLLIIRRGLFKTPPPGATMIEPGLAAAGTPRRISAALAQHRTGATGAFDLIRYGSQIGAGRAVWLTVRGGTALPLSGNLANLNHLLEDATIAGAALDLGEETYLRVDAEGRTADSADRLEQRLRALVSMAKEAEIHGPEIEQLLDGASMARSGPEVTLTLSAPPDAVAKLLAGLAR